MRHRCSSAIVFSLVCLCSSIAHAGAGEHPLDFLFLDAGARPAALAGAYTALGDDVYALRYNPAGLSRLGENELSFTDNRHFQGVSQQYVAFAHVSGWAAALDHVSYGEIPRTTISDPDSTLGEFGVRDVAFSVGHGRALYDDFGVGLSAKFIRETLDDVVANAYVMDAGLHYDVRSVSGLSFGAVYRNIGTKVRFEGAGEELPGELRVGAAYTFKRKRHRHSLAMDVTRQRKSKPEIHLGAEVQMADPMRLRLGFNTRMDSGLGLNVGFGWNFQRFTLDYAFVPAGILGNSHRVSVGVRWGDVGGKAVAKAAVEPNKELPGYTRTKALSIDSNAHIRKAAEWMNLGQWGEAEKELKKSLGGSSDLRIQALERLGRIEYYRGNCPEARKHYREAIKWGIKQDPYNTHVAEAYAGIGLCLIDEGSPQEAKKFFDRALNVLGTPP